MLAETAAEAARRFGDRPALVAHEGWALSYAELDRAADEVAAGLQAQGIGEGTVVALALPAIPEHVVAFLAAAKLGAVTAAVNARLTPVERDAVLAIARPGVVLATPELSPPATPGRPARGPDGGPSGGPAVIEVHPAGAPEEIFSRLRISGGQPVPLVADPERPVAIVFTSGTTGLPKGAVYCGRQLAFITRRDVGPVWGGGGPMLAGPALAHLGPITKLAGNLRRGATLHLMTSWRAAEALRRIASFGVTGIGGVPTQLALMLADPEFDRFDLSRVRAIVIGGGPATPALIRQARRRFGAALAVRYSCTEAGIGTATALDAPEEDAELSVGRPQPGVRLQVRGEDGRELGPGEVGEICLGSGAVMDGYWGDPEATAEALTADGAVRTGDLGWIDELGRLRLTGRLRERYVRGGENVYPMEVESVLADHPGVAAVAVVARRDPVMGEVGVAVVVPECHGEVADLGSLRQFAAARLARYKLPDELRLVEAMPLTAMDKLDRRALERLVGAGPATWTAPRTAPGGPAPE